MASLGHKKLITGCMTIHDDVIKWKHMPRFWPFVRGIHRSPVNSPHKGQRRGALMFSLICAWLNGWANNREAGDLRRHRAHYDVIVMNTTKQNKIVFMNHVVYCIVPLYHDLKPECTKASYWNTIWPFNFKEIDTRTFHKFPYRPWDMPIKLSQQRKHGAVLFTRLIAKKKRFLA